MNSFEQLLQEKFNLKDFRLGQKEIIKTVLDKNDALAVLPTGGGKSLCYQYPAVYRQGLVVVVSPLIALMKDQVQSLKRQGIPAGCLYSGQSVDEKKYVFSEMNKGGSFILYLSPERVQKEGFQKWIAKRNIVLFAIDESHCVSQWGHDFREEYSQLNILKKLRPDVPILALTASATPLVLNDIAKNLQLKKPVKMVHGFYRPNLYYQVEHCFDDNEKALLLVQAIKQNPEGRVLVYCGTRRAAEEVSFFLSEQFSQVEYYHAGLPTAERTRIQDLYIESEIRILVATNAFGMGIDQPDVRLVVHYQMPANIDSLYQEMGRAGRDEKESTCLMLYSKKDKGLQSFFIQSSDAPYSIKELRYRNLDTLVDYSEGSECRHSEILTYYKDSQRITNCGHCDVCDPESSRRIQRVDFVPSPSVKIKKTRIKKVSTTDVVMDLIQEERFKALKVWRKSKAQELDIPAFVVFSDKTLRDIAIKNPQNLDQLKTIHGIGETKLQKFGQDILSLK